MLKTGRIRFFSVLVLTSVSTDQAITSLRGSSGANGLPAPCVPAPLPAGGAAIGDDKVCAVAGAIAVKLAPARQNAVPKTTSPIFKSFAMLRSL